MEADCTGSRVVLRREHWAGYDTTNFNDFMQFQYFCNELRLYQTPNLVKVQENILTLVGPPAKS